MKKTVSKFLLFLALGMGVQTSILQSSSDAFILVYSASWHRRPLFFTPGGAVACLIFLPFCLFDQKSGPNSTSAQDLLDNGYTQAQVDNIVSDQNAVMTKLNDVGASVNLSKSDTVESIKRGLASVNLSVSDDYAQFLLDSQK